MTRRGRLCIVSLSRIDRDARVLRQIRHLSKRLDVVVVGQGPPPRGERFEGLVGWHVLPAEEPFDAAHLRHSLPAPVRRSLTALELARRGALRAHLRQRLLDRVLLGSGIGERWRDAYERRYWALPGVEEAVEVLRREQFDAIHANDWTTLPLAVEAGEAQGAPVVYDAHEFAPLEFEYDPRWVQWQQPMITHLLAAYAPRVARSVTVAPAIAERLAAEFGLDPIVVLNAPERGARPDRAPRSGRQLALVHHGGAVRDRGLEAIIEAVGRAEPSVTLELMLLGDDGYIAELEALARDVGGGRVRFRPPVPPQDIVRTLAPFDAGLYALPALGFNHAVALPNKLFDFLHAGLPVVVGPTPGMKAFVDEHRVGAVAQGFDPASIAAAINEFARAGVERWWPAVDAVCERINAASEHDRLMALYEELLDAPA